MFSGALGYGYTDPIPGGGTTPTTFGDLLLGY
jgi:hypothetical protein